MNRKEIEKEFDEKFPQSEWKIFSWLQFDRCPCPDKIKSFFFDEILPEVLRELLPDTLGWHREEEKHIFAQWFDFCVSQIKENAKEKYNITL